MSMDHWYNDPDKGKP